MYEIGITAQFEAAHHLVGDFGPAVRTHGHTYRLDVIVRGERLGEGEVLYDIGRLQPAIQELAASLHYRDLNELPDFAGRNPTAESVAGHCWDQLAPALHGHGLSSLAVRVWESPQVYAGRDESLRP
jgi:6-pyruvoyltetrahydropterin/6-carboxytetrahydropterin synthase